VKSAVVICKTEPVIEALKVALGEDYLTHIVSTVDDGVEVMLRKSPDLVIFEAEPEAPERLEDIRKLASLSRSLPLVVIATSANSPFSRQAYEAGAAEVLGEPFDRDELFITIAKAERLRESAMRQAERTAPRPAPRDAGTAGSHTALSARAVIQSLSGLIRSSFRPRRLAEGLTKAARDLFAPSQVAVFLLNKPRSHYVPAAAINYAGEMLEGLTVKRTDPLAVWLVRNRRILTEEELSQAPQSDESSAVLRSLSALEGKVLVPLLATGRLNGFMVLGNRLTAGSFAPEEIELLALLGSVSSPAIERALDLGWAEAEGRELRGLFGARAGVIVVDSEGSVENLNQRAATYLGTSSERAQGKRLSGLNAELADAAETCIENGKPHSLALPSTNESPGPLITTCFPIESNGSNHGGAILLIYESALEGAAEAVEKPQLRTFWSNLSTRLAHEVKNPLVAIKTFTQLLPERYGEEAFRNQFFKVVSGEVDRLNAITEQLVRFAHPAQLTLSPVGMASVARLALSELDEEIRLSKTSVDIDIPQDLPKVLADATALKEALTYVLGNSIDTSMETNAPRIVLTAEQVDTSVRVTIEDFGEGIGEADLENIFNPFFTTKIRGIGLGLPIARRIIDDHGGKIWLESKEGEGTRVHIDLPLVGSGHEEHSRR
jgi:signal transduction histidine kinase/DNA-binding NarL/FixJ family response regulator/GAF domain-containing protein